MVPRSIEWQKYLSKGRGNTMPRLQDGKWTLKFKVALLLAALTVFSILSACGSSSTSSTYNGPATPANLHIINDSTHQINILEATPSSSSTWYNVHYLGSFLPTNTFDMTSLVPGTYDFCAIANVGGSGYAACTWGFNLAPGTTVTFDIKDADFDGLLNVVNNTGVSITAVYVSADSGATWSSNKLGSPLANGLTGSLDIAPGAYTVRVVYSSSNHDYSSTISGFAAWTLNVP